MGKVILMSWPIGLLLLALNPLFVLGENAFTSNGTWVGVSSSLATAAKLWGLFVFVLMITAGWTFWSGVRASRGETKVR